MASWYTSGARARTPADNCGTRPATNNDRKSYQRTKVAGSSESMCVPLVNVNHFRRVPVKREASAGQ